MTIMIVSEAATIAKIEPFWSWNTPIAWTGFIIFADAVVWRARGDSWLRSAPREFAALALVSIPLWLVFEGYNLVIRNWHYVGLPENPALRNVGYAWSFATIWPAMFETGDLISSLRDRRAPLTRADEPLPHPLRTAGWICMAAGVLMLAVPILLRGTPLATYLAAPVWLGFILLLDPLNARAGGESLLADWREGRTGRTVNLLVAGLICGLLWEFWNYWSGAKWVYSVPILPHVKIFEMPIVGFLGFPAFALECFVMYVAVRRWEWLGAGRPISI
jgi:hypothetical protein